MKTGKGNMAWLNDKRIVTICKMKEKIISKYTLLLALGFLFYSKISFSQRKPFLLSVRISGQSDFQKAEYRGGSFPYEFKEYKNTVYNFGADVLTGIEIKNKWSVFMGLGYFRNQFIQHRQYDHQLLNMGTDSLPIGTKVSNYIFHLLRVPIGVSYKIAAKNKYEIDLGVENIVNFSFTQVYNGGLPFAGANNRYSKLEYYGNSINFFVQGSKNFNKNSQLYLSPYVRLWNIYKRKNPVLYENDNNYYSRFFDALGVSLKYSFNFKNSK